MLPLFFSGLLSCLVGMTRKTSRCSHARETVLTSSLCKKPIYNAVRHFFVKDTIVGPMIPKEMKI